MALQECPKCGANVEPERQRCPECDAVIPAKAGIGSYLVLVIFVGLIFVAWNNLSDYFGGNGMSTSNSTVQSNTSSSPPARTFIEADFYWDSTLEPHKDIIIRGVNMVHRDNSACSTIDPSSAYISSSRGSASNPVFYVTCGSGPSASNVFFSKSDVESGAPMRAPVHISRAAAIQGCEDYAMANGNQPSSVSFSRVTDLAVTEHPNGRTTLNSSFTAENALGVEQTFNIRCLFDGESLLEGTISEPN